MFVNELQEALPPPSNRRGILAWIRQNLFPNWWNGLLTLGLAYLLLPAIWSALDWALFSASWLGSSRADCVQGGACWIFIESRLGQYLYGFYPVDQYWRINLVFAGLAVSTTSQPLRGSIQTHMLPRLANARGSSSSATRSRSSFIAFLPGAKP